VADGVAGVVKGGQMTSAYDERPWLRWYPQGVPHDVDVPEVPLTHLLDESARRFGRRPAVEFLGRSLTYKRLVGYVDRFAAALADLGVRRGDRVALVLPNSPQAVITFYAVLRLGAVVVQHNPLYTVHELRHQLVDSGCRVVVCYDGVYARIAEAREGTAVRDVVVTSLADFLPRLKRRLLDLPVSSAREKREKLVTPLPDDADVTDFVQALTDTPGPHRQVPVDADDVALLQYTGGTTGLPKGAMLTHRNLVANAYQTRSWDHRIVDGEESTLAVLPLFHVYGLTLCLTTSLAAGGTLVLLPTFDPDLVLDAVRKHRPTIFPGVPPMYAKLLEHPRLDKYDLKSIRTCVSGAMRLAPEVVDAFEEATGGHLVEGYGLTESSPVALANPLNANARAGTVGLPLPGTEARVVDEHASDPDRVVEPGLAGELAVRGPQVFPGYWGQPSESASMLRDGWLLTGDIAVMSPAGYFTVIDRKRDVINASGFSIFPSEIEDALLEHPSIAECAVVGVPDAYRGETVKAYVVSRPGTVLTLSEVEQYCAERLAAYKTPKLVEFREELPRNMLGKVLRRVLREEHKSRQRA
jgi:long-chain acyl-CoA synthetase